MGKRIIMLLLALFSLYIASAQNVKHEPVLAAPELGFGKFIPDSINNARVNEILAADSLFIKDHSGRISSFEVYVNTGRIAITESIYGNRLSKKQKLLISSAQPGQKIYFQNIMVKYPGKEKSKSNSTFIFQVR